MKNRTTAQKAGATDGSVAALLQNSRDYSDDFVRRVELADSDRAEYRAAWYSSHEDTSRTFHVGRYAK